MVISSKKVIKADYMMNRGRFTRKFKDLFFKDYIMDFLVSMRKCSYYSHGGGKSCYILRGYYKWRFLRLSKELNYSIGCNCFSYGLVLHHYGTIVVGTDTRIGNFANILHSTTISRGGSSIGDFFSWEVEP